MKKVSELSDRELQEWNYEMATRSERHLNFIASYFKVVSAVAVMALIGFAVVMLMEM